MELFSSLLQKEGKCRCEIIKTVIGDVPTVCRICYQLLLC